MKPWRCSSCGRFNSSSGIPDCQYCAQLARQIESRKRYERQRQAEMDRRIAEWLSRDQ